MQRVCQIHTVKGWRLGFWEPANTSSAVERYLPIPNFLGFSHMRHTSMFQIKQILILNKDKPNFLNYDFIHSFIKKKKKTIQTCLDCIYKKKKKKRLLLSHSEVD